MKTGTVNLPLHSGKCPRWLFPRMKELGGVIAEAIVLEQSPDFFLRRLADPFWFQALGNVLGFDWHSSGLTTTVCGALKAAVNKKNLGIRFAGGKGKTSRKAPAEIKNSGDALWLTTKKTDKIVYASKTSARVDNNALQDGYNLYHHVLAFTEKGNWAIVQQGMNPASKYARRYHWLSDSVRDFVEEPHSAVCCDRKEERVIDLTAKESREVKSICVDLVNDGPRHLRKYMLPKGQTSLTMTRQHSIPGASNLNMRGLERAHELQPKTLEGLLATKGVGPKTIRALAMISKLVYGEPVEWKDPVQYSFAHGGKDGHPYPVDKPTYDRSIQTLQEAIWNAKMDKHKKLKALRRLGEVY